MVSWLGFPNQCLVTNTLQVQVSLSPCHVPLGTCSLGTGINTNTLATAVALTNKLFFVPDSEISCLLLASMKLCEANLFAIRVECQSLCCSCHTTPPQEWRKYMGTKPDYKLMYDIAEICEITLKENG